MSPAGVRAVQRLEVRADLVVHALRHRLDVPQMRHVARFGDLKDVSVHRNGHVMIQRHEANAVCHLREFNRLDS